MTLTRRGGKLTLNHVSHKGNFCARRPAVEAVGEGSGSVPRPNKSLHDFKEEVFMAGNVNFKDQEATIGGSTYVRPQDMEWQPSQFPGISIKVLYENPDEGELTCLLKWEPGASLPFHQHPEIEQSFVLEGSFYDHDGICRAGEYVWRKPGSFHETHTDEGVTLLAIYRKPNVFAETSGFGVGE